MTVAEDTGALTGRFRLHESSSVIFGSDGFFSEAAEYASVNI
jgi:hypothetical protein